MLQKNLRDRFFVRKGPQVHPGLLVGSRCGQVQRCALRRKARRKSLGLTRCELPHGQRCETLDKNTWGFTGCGCLRSEICLPKGEPPTSNLFPMPFAVLRSLMEGPVAARTPRNLNITESDWTSHMFPAR